MKVFYQFFVLFLLFAGYVVQAQNAYLQKKVVRIDSLMDKYYSNYDQAANEINELYQLITTKYNTKEYKGFKVDVMLQKSILVSLNGEHHKALKIALEALDEAEKYKLPERIYRACWIVAIMYENGGEYALCKKYLDKVFTTYKKYELENVYSVYCIRMSSYYRLVNKKDSAVYFAYRGLEFAKKYQNKREIRDAHLLLAGFLSRDNYKASIKYASMAAQEFVDIEDFTSAANQLTGGAHTLLRHNQTDLAFKYSDSAIALLKKKKSYVSPMVYDVRSQLFEKKGNIDSAFYYFKQYHNIIIDEKDKMEVSEIKKISEKYLNDKKEVTIKNKDQQILFIIILLSILSIGTIAIIRRNRQIQSQNKIINRQLDQLVKTLEQKKVLLSELQHRVKNNLQHVISILEIQKESVDFNNIDELIRGNQNRIHSMALLHKKLNVADSVNEVELKVYVTELSELVKESYNNYKKRINLNVNCEIEEISLEKALPIGLILVELISNSIKHAFKKRSVGIINIEITRDEITKTSRLYYSDNGDGFDFDKTNDKGLGLEITKGLIDQINGIIETKKDNGFELLIYFK